MEIKVDPLEHEQVIQLLNDHLDDMNATSPPESVHALDVEALKANDITFWTGWHNGQLLGCIAIKELSEHHAEIKSMRSTSLARNKGVATTLLNHLFEQAKLRGYQQLSLETGTMTFFEPARRLYTKHGFKLCAPFAGYQLDPNSCFMTLKI